MFWPKIRVANLLKITEICFNWKLLCRSLTEVQIWYWKPFNFSLLHFFWKINEVLAKISLFPLELPNELTHRILGNNEISGKSQNFIELLPSAQSSSRNKKQKLNIFRSALSHKRTRFCKLWLHKCFIYHWRAAKNAIFLPLTFSYF